MTDQVGLTGGRKLFACLAHYFLKDSFNMNKIIWYPSFIALMEDTLLNLDYTKMGPKSIIQGDADQAHLLSRITTEGHNCTNPVLYGGSQKIWDPEDPEEKAMVTGLWKSQAFIARGLIYYLTYTWGFRSDDPWGFKSQLSHFSPSSTIEAAKVKESLKVGVIGLCLFSIRSCPAVLATWHQLQIARTLLKAWLKRKQQQGLILTYMG